MAAVGYNRHLGAELEVVGSFRRRDGIHAVYADPLPAFAKKLKRRIKDDRQNVIAVTGDTGSGKSTFAIQLCLALDPKWRIEDNYIYSASDLKKKLQDPNASPISLFDEGSISLNSNNSMKGDDKMLVALFDTMRSRHWTTIICIPELSMLNKRIREVHVDYVCRCPVQPVIPGYDTRGFIQIYVRRSREWGKSYYQLVVTGLFKPLKPSVLERYQKVKKAHQDQLIDVFVQEEDIL